LVSNAGNKVFFGEKDNMYLINGIKHLVLDHP